MAGSARKYFIPDNFRLMAPPGEYRGLDDWTIAKEQVPQLGTQRGLVIKQLNNEFGYLTWRFAWLVAPGKYVPFRNAVTLYEKSYENHLRSHPDKLRYIADNAQDVFDNDESNVLSGVNYFIQGRKLTHLQDIAIRRVMRTLGYSFGGTRLIRVRKSRNADSIGRSLSPKFVPFCVPEIVRGFSQNDRERIPSVDDFWQNNRVIQFSEHLSSLSPRERQDHVENPSSFDEGSANAI